MEFIQTINEHVNSVSLQKWNLKQANLWNDLIQDKEVEKNDVTTFIEFAKFFDLYYKKNKKFPTKKIIEKEVLHV